MTAPLLGQPATSSPPAKLGSAVFRWEELAVKKTPVGERREMHDGPTATMRTFECHATTLNPGNVSHPPHRHAHEEFIILKTGALSAHVNGRETPIRAGSLVFFGSNDAHAVKNVGEVPATYLVFNFHTALTSAAPEAGAEKAAAAGKMASRICDWEKLEVVKTRVGERRPFFDAATTTSPRVTVHATTLNAGEISHPAHRHPDEELIIVKEGTVEATINGTPHRAGAGSIFFFASNDEHGLRNAGDSRATYYVVRIVTELTPAATTP